MIEETDGNIGKVIKIPHVGYITITAKNSIGYQVARCYKSGRIIKNQRPYSVTEKALSELIIDEEIYQSGVSSVSNNPLSHYASTDKPEKFDTRLKEEESSWD